MPWCIPHSTADRFYWLHIVWQWHSQINARNAFFCLVASQDGPKWLAEFSSLPPQNLLPAKIDEHLWIIRSEKNLQFPCRMLFLSVARSNSGGRGFSSIICFRSPNFAKPLTLACWNSTSRHQSRAWGLKNSQRWQLFFQHFRQFKEKQWPSFFSYLLRGHTKAIITAHAPGPQPPARSCGRVRARGPTRSAPKQRK